jgi:hypothetical protein
MTTRETTLPLRGKRFGLKALERIVGLPEK